MTNAENNIIRFGGCGHEREYVFHVKGFGHENYIPKFIERELQKQLPDWDISSRGSRVEIIGRKSGSHYGDRDDAEVVPAVAQVLRLYEVDQREWYEEDVDLGVLRLTAEIARNILGNLFNQLEQVGDTEQEALLTAIVNLDERVTGVKGCYCDEQLSADVLQLHGAVLLSAHSGEKISTY